LAKELGEKQRLTKFWPPVSSSIKTRVLAPIINSVTSGKCLGWRVASLMGNIVSSLLGEELWTEALFEDWVLVH
jgi:hypothetical protein